MRTILRRLRGLLGTALLWAMAWGMAGVVLGFIVALADVGNFILVAPDAMSFVGFVMGVYGAVGGLVFASVMMLLERRRRLEDLSLRRVAAWGAIGGMGLPAAVIAAAPIPIALGTFGGLAVTGALGAACSAGTLALARRPVSTLDRT
jgi:hypothetical protein